MTKRDSDTHIDTDSKIPKFDENATEENTLEENAIEEEYTSSEEEENELDDKKHDVIIRKKWLELVNDLKNTGKYARAIIDEFYNLFKQYAINALKDGILHFIDKNEFPQQCISSIYKNKVLVSDQKISQIYYDELIYHISCYQIKDRIDATSLIVLKYFDGVILIEGIFENFIPHGICLMKKHLTTGACFIYKGNFNEGVMHGIFKSCVTDTRDIEILKKENPNKYRYSTCPIIDNHHILEYNNGVQGVLEIYHHIHYSVGGFSNPSNTDISINYMHNNDIIEVVMNEDESVTYNVRFLIENGKISIYQIVEMYGETDNEDQIRLSYISVSPAQIDLSIEKYTKDGVYHEEVDLYRQYPSIQPIKKFAFNDVLFRYNQ